MSEFLSAVFRCLLPGSCRYCGKSATNIGCYEPNPNRLTPEGKQRKFFYALCGACALHVRNATKRGRALMRAIEAEFDPLVSLPAGESTPIGPGVDLAEVLIGGPLADLLPGAGDD